MMQTYVCDGPLVTVIMFNVSQVIVNQNLTNAAKSTASLHCPGPFLQCHHSCLSRSLAVALAQEGHDHLLHAFRSYEWALETCSSLCSLSAIKAVQMLHEAPTHKKSDIPNKAWNKAHTMK